jgi:hypothetical protein
MNSEAYQKYSRQVPNLKRKLINKEQCNALSRHFGPMLTKGEPYRELQQNGLNLTKYEKEIVVGTAGRSRSWRHVPYITGALFTYHMVREDYDETWRIWGLKFFVAPIMCSFALSFIEKSHLKI